MQKTTLMKWAAGMLLGTSILAVHAQEPIPARAAHVSAHAAQAMMLSVANAGKRIVAVGANGYVILSDDGGKTYRQAKSVPVDFTFTGVWFAGDKSGWAVGHGGAIIHSADGGDTWTVQRTDTQVDQPLYSVYFGDAQNGWAAGLWSLLLHTEDGGKNWSQIRLPVAAGQKRADLNLLRIFPGRGDDLYIAAEQGTLFRSKDKGASWDVIKTGSKASLWTGVVTSTGSVIVGGLGGKLLRSADGGNSWHQLESPTTGSITGLLARDGVIRAASLEGVELQSDDDGNHWRTVASARLPLTAIGLNDEGKVQAFSKEGPVELVRKSGK